MFAVGWPGMEGGRGGRVAVKGGTRGRVTDAAVLFGPVPACIYMYMCIYIVGGGGSMW